VNIPDTEAGQDLTSSSEEALLIINLGRGRESAMPRWLRIVGETRASMCAVFIPTSFVPCERKDEIL